MIEVYVYNTQGQVEYVLELPEDVQFVSGRTSRSDRLHYKGVGSRYVGHYSITPAAYEKISESSVFYYGWNVKNRNWDSKFGIFNDKFQPYFSDYIGTCGNKELRIISNSSQFELSAVDVVDVIEHNSINKQYYFVLNYKSPRNKYDGNATALINLLVYMVQSGWCFPWDKTSINDINNYGCVTDVADIFQSSDIKHLYGSVYSVFYSLYQMDNINYNKLLKTMNYSYMTLHYLPFVVMLFLKNCGKEVYIKQSIISQSQLYTHLVGNVLLRGKNCAGVESEQKSDMVMLQYLDRFKQKLFGSDLSVLEVY